MHFNNPQQGQVDADPIIVPKFQNDWVVDDDMSSEGFGDSLIIRFMCVPATC